MASDPSKPSNIRDYRLPVNTGIRPDAFAETVPLMDINNFVLNPDGSGIRPREGLEVRRVDDIGRLTGKKSIYFVNTPPDISGGDLIVIVNNKQDRRVNECTELVTAADIPFAAASWDNATVGFTEETYGYVDSDFTQVPFSIVRSGGGLETFTISIRTVDGTATAGTDYTAIDTDVTFNGTDTTYNSHVVVADGSKNSGKTFSIEIYAKPDNVTYTIQEASVTLSIPAAPSLRFLSGPAFFMPAADNFHVLMMDEVTYDTNVVTLGMGTLNWDADAPHNTLIHFFDETPYYLLLNLYIDPATTTTTPGHWLIVYSLEDIKDDPTATAAPLHVIQISDDFYRTYSNCPTAAGCDSTGLYYLVDTTSDTGFLSSVDLETGTVTSISTDFVPATGFYKDATGPSGIRHAQFDSRGNLVVSAQADISTVSRQIVMVLGPDGVINLPDSGTYTYPGTGVNPMGHVAPSASGSVHLYNMDATSPSTDNNVVTYDFTDYTETAMSGYVMDISADGTRVVCFDWVSGGASAIAVRNFPGTTAHEQIELLSPGTIMNFISANNFMRTNGSDDPVKIYATADISLVETIDVATLLSDYYTSDQIDTTSNYAAFRARNIYGTFGGLS
jgi:hypothetical protein